MTDVMLDKINAAKFHARTLDLNHECRGSIGACAATGDDQCVVCGERDCPSGDPLHYTRGGCPCCVFGDIPWKDHRYPHPIPSLGMDGYKLTPEKLARKNKIRTSVEVKKEEFLANHEPDSQPPLQPEQLSTQR